MKILSLIVGIVILCGIMTGCSLGRKTWGGATSVDAFKIKIPSTDGQSAIELNAGGGTNCTAFQATRKEGEKVSRVMQFSRRASFWDLFSSDISSGNVSFNYFSGDDESPEETKIILDGVANVVNWDGKTTATDTADSEAGK